MTNPETLNQIIGSNLKELRRTRSITLDNCAEATGVSRSMLGQIERGECGLSVATLWKISTGLGIPFTTLMTQDSPPAELVDNRSLQPLTSDSPGFRLYPIFPVAPDRGFEILYIEIDPGVRSRSLPHDQGTEEFILVQEGTLTVTLGEVSHQVCACQSLRCNADQNHCYANETQEPVRLCMVIHSTVKA